MGAKIEELPDGLVIDQDGSWSLRAAKLDGYHDHRMVMALSIAGMGADGTTEITGAEMVEKSFDTYIPEMKKAGANFEVEKV